MKLGHPGEIIFTEETLETNSHQCNNLVLGLWPRTDSCAERRWLVLREASHSPKGTDSADGKVALLPPRQREWGLFKAKNRNELGNKKLYKVFLGGNDVSMQVHQLQQRCQSGGER